MSLIAMAWNYVYNYGYDKIFGADRTKRTKKTRVLHGLGLVVFFVVYVIGFNWAYDSARALVVGKGKVKALA